MLSSDQMCSEVSVVPGSEKELSGMRMELV